MPRIVTDLDRSRAITPARPWALLLVAMFMVVSAACGVIGSDTAEAALNDETSQPTAEPVQLPEVSATPDVEPTSTAIPTTPVRESTPTAAPIPAAPTSTPTPAPTVVPAPLPTATPIATATSLATATATIAPTLTSTLLAILVPSPTPFVTLTPTPSPTPMASPMPSPTSTPTPKPVPTVLLTNFPKVSIVSYTPASATTVLVGAQVNLGVTLKNTGTIAWQYVVEAVVLDDQGIVIGLFNTALPSALQPDAQTSVTWNAQMLQAGSYWVQYSVWKDSGQSEGSLLAVAPSTSTKLIVGTNPPTPTPTATPVLTPTAIPTSTPIPPTPTPTPFPTVTPTPSPTPTPTPAPALAVAPVASIISYTPAGLVTVNVGQPVSLSVTLKNTGTVAWQYVVEAVVTDSQGIVIGQFNTALSTTLQPNASTTVNWSVQVLQAGDYWIQYSVWKTSGRPETGLIDVKPFPSAKLIVGQIPPTPTATPIPSPTPFPTSTPLPSVTPIPTSTPPPPVPSATPTPTPAPLLPPSPMASIVSYTPASAVTVLLGQQASLSVTFTNSGTVAWQFVAEATVWNAEGSVVGLFNTALGTALEPTKQATVTWSVGVLQVGDYWVQYSVRKTSGVGETNLLDQAPVPSVKLITGVAPTPTPTPLATATPTMTPVP